MQQQERADKAEAEKERIMNLITNEIMNETDISEARSNMDKGSDDIDVISFAWRSADERRSLMMGEIQNEFKNNSLKVQAQIEERMKNEAFEQIELAKSELNKQHAILLASELDRQRLEFEKVISASKSNDDKTIPASENIAANAEIDVLKKELSSKTKEMEDMKQELESEIESIKKEHEKSICQLKEKAQKFVLYTKQEIQHKHDAEKNIAISTLANLQSEFTESENKLKAQVALLESNLEKREKEIEDINDCHVTQIKEARESVMKRAKEINEEELLRVKNELTRIYEQKIESLKESQEMIISSAAEVHLEEVEELKVKLDHMQVKNCQIDEVKSKYDDEISRVEEEERMCLENAALLHAEKMQTELKTVHDNQIRDLEAAASAKLSHELEKIQNAHRHEVETLNNQLSRLKSSTADEQTKISVLEEKIRVMSIEHESSLVKVREEASSAMSNFRTEMEQSKYLAIEDREKQLNAAHREEMKRVVLDGETRFKEERELALENLRKEMDANYQIVVRESEERTAKLETALDENRMEKEIKEKKLEAAEASVKASEGKIMQLNDDLSKQKASFEDELHQMKIDSGVQLRQETDALKAKIGSSEGDVKAAGEATQVLEERIRKLEKERESLVEKHSIEIEESIAKNVEEKGALTKSIDKLNSTVNDLESQLAEEEVVKEQLIAEGKVKEEELQASLQQLREEVSSKGSLTDDLEKAHKVELDRLRQETDALKAKVGSSEGDVKAAGEATQGLEERVKELEKERKSLVEKHSIEMDELKTKVRKGISSYKEEINSLTENLMSAKDSNEQLIMQSEEHKMMETSLKKDLLEARSDAKLVDGLRNSLEQSTSQLEAERKLSSNMRSDLQAMKKAHDESTVNIQMKFADQLKSSEIEIMKHKDQISALQSELSSSRDTIDKLTEAMATTRNSLEVSEQNERSLKSRVGDLETSLNEAITNSRSTATSLIDRQETLENENNKLKDLLEKSKQRDMTSREKIKAISSELESTRKSKDEAISNEKMLSEKLAEEMNSKLTSSASDLALARNEISTLKSDQATLENTLARFKTERDASERRHGQRTALVGMLEAQLNEQKEENTQTKSKVDELLSCIDQKEQDILQLEKELETAKAGLHEAKQSKEKFADRNIASAEIARKDIERQHRAQLEALQQQMARKSAAAQKLLQQREQECIELRKGNKAMKHELDSGSSSDRHIFELAAKVSTLFKS